MRSSRIIALAMSFLLIAGLLVDSATAAQPSVAEPELFDLGLAQSNLDQILAEANRLRHEIADILEQVDGLEIERDFIDLNEQERNNVMQRSRTRARNMAINAYIGIGPPLNGAVVLDATTANDLSYRHGLLRQQAERLHEAAETYTVLAGRANETVLELSDSINGQVRNVEALNRALSRQVEQVPHAEWVVSIARIHHEADQEFATGRWREPTEEQWQNLRHCESTETYDIDTGNTFYGAYQFTWETWGTVGGSDNPAAASPEEQDARARLLYSRRGAQPWPICGRFLPN